MQRSTRFPAAFIHRPPAVRSSPIWLGAATFLWIALFCGPSYAAPPHECRIYAAKAVAHQARNQSRQCGFAGDRWSTNHEGHYQWCLGASIQQLNTEDLGRFNEIFRCSRCNDYADEAIGAQQQNSDATCGYAGDAWSPNRTNHLRWCLAAGHAAADGQTNHRTAEIAKCSACRTYARNAVNAYTATRVCSLQGDRWSASEEGHFRWCTGVAAAQAQSEGAARAADAGKCQTCQGYAETAKAAQDANEAQACGFAGDAWSTNRDGHRNWCLGARSGDPERQTLARSNLLVRCRACEVYVSNAVRAQQENMRLGCGLAGDRWNEDRRRHAAWCAVAGPGMRDVETQARQALLVQCLVPGKRGACQTYAATAVAQNAENMRLDCNRRGGPWSNDRQNHYNWCLGVSANLSNRETLERERSLASCRNSMGRPVPSQCTVSVILSTRACANADGTPSTILSPGDLSGVGCGTDETSAVNAAKASLSSQRLLSEGDTPAPLACTYEKDITFQGCLCSR